jgi:hypothetical protein
MLIEHITRYPQQLSKILPKMSHSDPIQCRDQNPVQNRHPAAQNRHPRIRISPLPVTVYAQNRPMQKLHLGHAISALARLDFAYYLRRIKSQGSSPHTKDYRDGTL